MHGLSQKRPFFVKFDLSHLVRKPTICICEIKGADQLRSYCEADQRLCFRYRDSTIPLLSSSKISSLQPSSMIIQLSLCLTFLETTLLVFSRCDSFEVMAMNSCFMLSNCAMS